MSKLYLTPCQLWTDPTSNQGQERQLAYAIYGQQHQPAITVLFFPGAGLGRAALPLPNERLIELNVQLIITDRPGYGNSDLDTAHLESLKTDDEQLQFLLETNTRLVAGLLTSLKLPRVACLGHSAGALFMLHFVQTHPGRVASLSLVGCPTPLKGAHVPPEKFGRSIQSFMIRKVPGMFRWLFGMMAGKWQADVNEWVKFSVSQMTPTEKKFNTPFLDEMTKVSFGSSIHSKDPTTAVSMLTTELLASSFNWPFDLLAPCYMNGSFPVAIWHGSLDEVTPHGPWLAQLWTGHRPENIPPPVLHSSDGFSHGLIFFQFEAILLNAVTITPNQPSASASSSSTSSSQIPSI